MYRKDRRVVRPLRDKSLKKENFQGQSIVSISYRSVNGSENFC